MAAGALTWLAAVTSDVAHVEPSSEAAPKEKSQGCRNGTPAISQSPTGFPAAVTPGDTNYKQHLQITDQSQGRGQVWRERSGYPGRNCWLAWTPGGDDWRLRAGCDEASTMLSFWKRSLKSFVHLVIGFSPFSTHTYIYSLFMFSYSLSLAFSLFSSFNGVLVNGNS